MHQSFVATAHHTPLQLQGRVGDSVCVSGEERGRGCHVQGKEVFSSRAVPSMCWACDIMQNTPPQNLLFK